jgi:MoaA/NifB/PqqE/SkfB family radical SAM enzyme
MTGVIRRLPILILQPHGRCNCRCVMCDIWKVTDTAELTAAELKRHLADIESLGVEWVVFTGGEPLMHSDLFRLSRMLRERGVRTTILSSGLLLSRFAESIVAHTDDMIVSLDGPQAIHDEIRGVPRAFELLAEGVRAILFRSPQYTISARCTVQARNARYLLATVEAARSLGLRSISFLAADLASQAFNRLVPWPPVRQSAVVPDVAVLEQEIDRLIDTYPSDGFILESPAKLRRIVARFRAHLGMESHVAPRCNAPWVSAVVEHNGDMRPCFFHPPVGNTSQGSLTQVLNSPAAIAFRDQLDVATNPTCRRCVCSLYRPDVERI